MLQYWKNDYARVKSAMKFVSNDKMPDWACTILYILLLPLGLALMPFALLFMWYVNREMKKLEKDL